MNKVEKKRSDCPINTALEVWGDKWSLLILRDMILGGIKNYNDFLNSGEGISTNILANRLSSLENKQLLIKKKEGRKIEYLPTELTRSLVPALIEILIWGMYFDEDVKITKKDELYQALNYNFEDVPEYFDNPTPITALREWILQNKNEVIAMITQKVIVA